MSAPEQQADRSALAARAKAAANLTRRPDLRDAGPPHSSVLCLAEDWLCRYPADDGHPVHVPYVEGEYLR
ncbi:hypothetical protein [Kitasatospora sp. NPDC004272]